MQKRGAKDLQKIKKANIPRVTSCIEFSETAIWPSGEGENSYILIQSPH